MRKSIGPADGVREIMLLMSEGNPGAISVMNQLLSTRSPRPPLLVLLDLDDMNIHGPQLWVALKDFAGGDVEKLVAAVVARDKELVRVVNLASQDCGGFVAVESGASFKRPPLGRAPGVPATKFETEAEKW